jgi:MraZ protein
MPSKFRGKLEEGVMMVIWFEDCMAVFPKGEFDKLADKVESLPEGNKDKRELSRTLFGIAYEAVPDRQGRLTIPPMLRKIAGLEREVVVTGVRNHVEIWDRERWQKSMEERMKRYEEAADKLSELGF